MAPPGSVAASLDAVDGQDWDAVVIGAGTTGATAAAQLLQHGYRTLLTERATFPRPKVCGGCLTEIGVGGLRASGLGAALDRADPRLIDRCSIVVDGEAASLPLPRYAVVDRAQLDAALAAEVVARGGVFLESTQATVERDDRVRLRSHDGHCVLTPQIVVVADGLHGTALANRPEFAWSIQRGSYVGMSSIVESTNGPLDRDAITMYSTKDGYLGFAPLTTGGWVAAAAVSPRFLQHHGRDQALVQILKRNHITGICPEACRWIGVPQLTRHRSCVARGRVVVVGDAFRYLEPFTGEGMSWGILAAREVPDLARAVIDGRSVDRLWRRRYRTLLRRRSLTCRMVSAASRHPRILRMALRSTRSRLVASWLSRRVCWSAS